MRALAVRDDVRFDLVAPILADLNGSRLAQVEYAAMPLRDKLLNLLELFTDPDPFSRHAIARQLARSPILIRNLDLRPYLATEGPETRLGLLLACRASGGPEHVKLLREFLTDPDDEVRFLAAKWVADEKLVEHRAVIAAAMKKSGLNVPQYLAYATALARIDGQPVNEGKLAEYSSSA